MIALSQLSATAHSTYGIFAATLHVWWQFPSSTTPGHATLDRTSQQVKSTCVNPRNPLTFSSIWTQTQNTWRKYKICIKIFSISRNSDTGFIPNYISKYRKICSSMPQINIYRNTYTACMFITTLMQLNLVWIHLWFLLI